MLESHKKLLVALCIWMLILSEVAFAKTYQRKSISYINTLWLATPEARKISSAQAEELLSNIKKEMAMERFDYNPLPDDLVQKFVQEAKKAEALTLEQIVELLEETVVPAIIKVLNENMEVRAKELISEEERNSFIALKAKELGLTAEHFEKVLNSAYMYMPVLTNYSRSVSKQKIKEEGKTVTKNVIEYNLKGGIIWFSLKISDGKSRVEVVKHIEGNGSSLDTDDSTAFTEAALFLTEYLQIRTAEISDFNIQGKILECSGEKLGFNLGKKEGLFIDQKFRVYEETEDKYGNYKLKKRGFFTVRRIGDNRIDRNALSYGKSIIGAHDSGMLFEEFPRLSTDISCRVHMYRIKISPGKTNISPALSVDEEIDIMFPMFNFAIQKNIASTTRIPQFFVTLGGNVGTVPTNSVNVLFEKLPYPTETDFGICWNLYGGIMKKFYFKRFAFILEPICEYQNLTFRKQKKVENKQMDLSYNNSALLFSPLAGLEVALRADLNLGIMVGLKGLYYKSSNKLQPTLDIWKRKYSWIEDKGEYKIEGAEEKQVQVEHDWYLKGPQVEYINPFFGVHLNYSPGSLENIVKVVTQEKPYERICHINFLNRYTVRWGIGIKNPEKNPDLYEAFKGPFGRFVAGFALGTTVASISCIGLFYADAGDLSIPTSRAIGVIGSSVGVYSAGRLFGTRGSYWATLIGSALGAFAQKSSGKGSDDVYVIVPFIPSIGAEIGFELSRLIP